MKKMFYALMFCGMVAAPLLLPAEEEKLSELKAVPQRLIREVLADQKQLAPAAVEVIFTLEETDRAKLIELCRTDPEAAKKTILDKLGEKKLQKMQTVEAIRETARLCRLEKDEAKKAELRTKLRGLLAEQYNRTSEEVSVRLRIQEQRLAEVRRAYQQRVENADSAIDAQLERMLRPKQAKQPGQSGKKRK